MLSAKLHISRRLFLITDFSANDVLVTIIDNTGKELAYLSMTEAVPVLHTYYADYMFPAVGQYTLQYKSISQSFESFESIIVDENPKSNIKIGEGFKKGFEYSPGSIFTLKVYNQSFGEIGEFDLAEVEPGYYEPVDEIIVHEEGPYLFVWGDYYKVEEEDIWSDSTQPLLTIFTADYSAVPQVVVPGVTVLISKSDTTPVVQVITNIKGVTYARIAEGNYIVSMRKTGYVFNSNNTSLTIESASDEPKPTLYLNAKNFAPQFSTTPGIGVDKLSLMKVKIATVDGQSLGNVDIQIRPAYYPFNIDDWGIAGHGINISTNPDGYTEVYLLRGIKVEIAVEGTLIRREITVPDQDEFDLFDVLTEAGDPFDILIPAIPYASKESL